MMENEYCRSKKTTPTTESLDLYSTIHSKTKKERQPIKLSILE
jgi:hypothetical protein